MRISERFELDDLQRGYVDLVMYVVENGETATPRGIPTREVLGAQIVLRDPRNALPVGVGRGVSPTFNAAGAACLVGGVSYPEILTRIAPRFANFNRDGIDRERYGPRSWLQVLGCVRHLTEDPHSREAIVTVQPARTEEADGGRVFPCTTSIQFLLRDGALNCVVSMRSNDVWSGLSGDIWTFTQLQRTVAWALGAELGAYIHNAASLHIYANDGDPPGVERVPTLHYPNRPGIDINGFAAEETSGDNPLSRILLAQLYARAALGVGNEVGSSPLPANVAWYAGRLRDHWRANAMCADCREVTELKDTRHELACGHHQ